MAAVGTITEKAYKSAQDDYSVGKVLGTGAFSTVREGISRKNGDLTALKIISGSKFKRDERTTRILKNEINIMNKCGNIGNPSLMRLLDTYEEPTKLVLVLEHLSGGELFDRIVERGHYSEKDAAELMGELMQAMADLHANGVLHRDMKPENCIYATRDDDSAIKITDFGLAAMDERFGGFGDVHRSLVGTPGYVAPEVLQSRIYSPACDVWSMGVILYILLSGYPPFWAEDNASLFETIKRGDYEFHDDAWGTISDSAKDLVSKMLTVDSQKRLTSEEVLAHPWISDSMRNSTHHMQGAIERLVTFNAKRKFKAAAIAAVVATRGFNKSMLTDLIGASKFSTDEMRVLKSRFKEAAGGDANGCISQSKFEEVMKGLGYSQLPLDRLYKMFDRDGDDMVDYKEFLIGLGKMKDHGEANTKFCFDLYDEDGSGFISREELAKVLFSMADESDAEDLQKDGVLESIFTKLDTNQDNQISFMEFKRGVSDMPMLTKLLDITAAAANAPPPAPAADTTRPAAAAAPAAAAPGVAVPPPAPPATKGSSRKTLKCAIL